jgi:hypothetical protein
MTNQEKLEQALEALEMYCEHGAILRPLEIRDAIKEALAQSRSDVKQEQRSVSEQLGEPVALETVYETIIHWDEGGGKRSRRELARRIVALYTTPQQRKPLTFEQADDVALDVMGVSMLDKEQAETAHLLIRATEAAHGIKE